MNYNNTWVLICAYNEEKTIKEVILRTKKIIPNILIVNDGSTDNTKKIINKLNGIEKIHIKKNSGKSNAIRIGMNYLKEIKANKVITIDADLQHLPEEIPNLLNVKSADIIIGVRKKLNSPMPIVRKIGNYLASKIINIQTGTKINDPQSGFRVYNNKAINKLDFKGQGFNIEKKTLKQAVKLNLKIKESSISCIYNNKRKSYFTLKDALKFLNS